MKKLIFLAIILPTLAWANPPVAIGDCSSVSRFPEINASVFNVHCVDGAVKTDSDPMHYESAVMNYSVPMAGSARSEGWTFEGFTFSNESDYGILKEFKSVNNADGLATRTEKAIADAEPGHAGTDTSAQVGYTTPTNSIDPARPNKAVGNFQTLTPRADDPADGDAAYEARSAHPMRGKWKVAFNVDPESSKAALNAAGTPILLGFGDYIQSDEKGVHIVVMGSDSKPRDHLFER